MAALATMASVAARTTRVSASASAGRRRDKCSTTPRAIASIPALPRARASTVRSRHSRVRDIYTTKAAASESVDDVGEDAEVTEELRFLNIADDADAVRAGVDALKAKEIKDELKMFGVAIAGKKDQIVDRLVECYSLTAKGEDVVAAMQQRTIKKVTQVTEEAAASTARRDARRARAGAYSGVSDRTAKKLTAARRRAVAGATGAKASGITARRRSKLAEVADVDIEENNDEAQAQAAYSMANPVADAARKTKLNVAKRDLDRQMDFQGQMESEGWYMCEVPETRESQAAEKIEVISGTAKTDGEDLVVWVPRVPKDTFAVAESEAKGKTRIDLLRSVPDDENAVLPFPGYVLVHTKLTQTVLNSLEEIYGVKGFASSGVTKYGSTRRQTGEKPRRVPAMQLETMMKMCDVRVVSDAEHAVMAEALKKQAEAKARAEAMGSLPDADDAEIVDAMPSADAGDANDVSEPTVSAEAMAMREAAIHGGNKAPDGATQIEVKVGPFKGFKGYLTNDRGDDGADAKLVIFGRETDVTLEADEFVTL